MKAVPKPVIHELSRRFRADPESLEFLGGGQDWSDGTLFTFTPPAESSNPSALPAMVIKFLCFPKADSDALRRSMQRVDFIRYLGEKGSRIIMPEPSAEGRLYESIEMDGNVYFAYVYRKVIGRAVNKGDPSMRSGAFYSAMGAIIGKLHADWECRPETLRSDGTSGQSGVLTGWKSEWAFFRGWCKDEEVRRAWERLKNGLEKLPVDKGTYGFVHNDAHAWNLIFDPDAEPARSGGEPLFTVIDLDVSNYHFFLCDAATALYSIGMMYVGGIEAGKAIPEDFLEWAFGLFWDGYRRFRDADREWLEQLPLFLQYRRCLLFMPFQAQTEKDPAWRAHWKGSIRAEDRKLFG